MTDRAADLDRGDRYARTFDVLELLAGHPAGMTLTEISTRLSLPTSSTHNLLARMVGADVITVDATLRYAVGSRAVRLGIRIVDGLEVRAVARRHLQELSRVTGEAVYLAVRIDRRVTYIERLPGSRPVTVEIRLGQSLHLHATSVGKLFAAHHPELRDRLATEPLPRLTGATTTDPADLDRELRRIRERGHAVSRAEAVAGVTGLAVPVLDAHGALVAAIHVSALETHLTPDREADVLAAARVTAAAIARDLGRRA